MGNATKNVALGLGEVADRFRTVVVQGDGTYCSRTCSHYEVTHDGDLFCRRYCQFLNWDSVEGKAQPVRCEQCDSDPEVIETHA